MMFAPECIMNWLLVVGNKPCIVILNDIGKSKNHLAEHRVEN